MERSFLKKALIFTAGIIIIFLTQFIYRKILISESQHALNRFLSNREFNSDFVYPEDVRYRQVFLDNDNIPELFLAQGDCHVDQVLLYSFDKEKQAYVLEAAFSQFGKLSYLERQNQILSSYGGMGCYYIIVFNWNNNKEFELLHSFAIIERNYGKEEYLYENYPVSFSLIEPNMKCDGEWTDLDEQYCVLKFSSEDIYEGFEQVQYSEMKAIAVN